MLLLKGVNHEFSCILSCQGIHKGCRILNSRSFEAIRRHVKVDLLLRIEYFEKCREVNQLFFFDIHVLLGILQIMKLKHRKTRVDKRIKLQINT